MYFAQRYFFEQFVSGVANLPSHVVKLMNFWLLFQESDRSENRSQRNQSPAQDINRAFNVCYNHWDY